MITDPYPEWTEAAAMAATRVERDIDTLRQTLDYLEQLNPAVQSERGGTLDALYGWMEVLRDWRCGWPTRRAHDLTTVGSLQCYDCNREGSDVDHGCGRHEAKPALLAGYRYLDRPDARFIGTAHPDWLYDAKDLAEGNYWMQGDEDHLAQLTSLNILSPGGPFYALALYDPPLVEPTDVLLAWDQATARFIPVVVAWHVGETRWVAA
jgi:hypothetical protein